MSPEQWGLLATAAAGILGSLAALWKIVHDRRAGISSDERQARRDQSADWATFAQQMQDALAAERSSHQAAIARIDDLERRLQEKSLLLRAQGDHIDVLEDQIRHLGGTPTPRPAGI